MGIVELTRGQMSHSLALQRSGDNQIGFQNKLRELRREIQQLQLTYDRLEQANRRDANRAFSDGGSIRVVSQKVEQELAFLHGWVLSIAESMFTLVRIQFGAEDVRRLRDEWRRYF